MILETLPNARKNGQSQPPRGCCGCWVFDADTYFLNHRYLRRLASSLIVMLLHFFFRFLAMNMCLPYDIRTMVLFHFSPVPFSQRLNGSVIGLAYIFVGCRGCKSEN